MLLIGGMGIGLSHVLRFVILRKQWRRLSLIARVPRIVGTSLLLGLGAAAVMSGLGLASWQTTDLNVDLPVLQPLAVFAIQACNWLLLLLIWSSLYFGFLSVRERQQARLRESELARALQAAELRLLKSQLNPHFLFNALNTVRALIAAEPARAQSAVTQLARTLRYTLGSGQDELVTLEQELAIVAAYLELEALRLGERLRVERDIATQARRVRIPVMLLQILVENAIKHGIAELPAGGVLRIHAAVSGGTLALEVENPRPAPRRATRHAGIGVNNAQKRLQLLFGADATVELDLSRPACALARVRLPSTAP
jgi:LytS/YehU family sensor histidine kinase